MRRNSRLFRIFAIAMKHSLFLCTLLLALLSACHDGQRREMLTLLDEADSLNRAYAPLPSDSLLHRAADFFDRHGSPGEQVRAHYLLGCAFRDQGQAPEALQCYQDAIDRADATARDSTQNALLCRVYSQMADIFYQQNLISDQLICLDRSIDYALASKDTIASINSFLHKMGAYIKWNRPDSVVKIFDNVCSMCSQHNCDWLAASGALTALPSLLELRQYKRAAECITLYEEKSGYVDSIGHVAKGKESYYCLKGMYYLAINKLDSAERMFRKTLLEGKDFNCQNGGSHGLAELYKKTNNNDSALIYALYSYDMNDSVYARMAIDEVGQVKALYNYSVYQRDAREANEKAYRERAKVLLLSALLLLSLLFITFISKRWKRNRKAIMAKYNNVVERLNVAQTEILRIRSREDELNKYIEEKENEVENLLCEFSSLKEKNEREREPLQPIEEIPIYKLLQSKAIKGIGLSDDEWLELNSMVIKRQSTFYLYVSDRRHNLKLQEYRVCVLLHLGVKPIDISHMFEVDPAYVTRLGKSALRKLFGCDGKIRDLVEKMNSIEQ